MSDEGYDDFVPVAPYMVLTIYDDPDDEVVNSGILDAQGNPILYSIQRRPIGFLWHDEDGNLRPRHLFEGES